MLKGWLRSELSSDGSFLTRFWLRWRACRRRSLTGNSAACRSRFAFSARCCAGCNIPVQACFSSGRRIWHAVARGETYASRAYCSNDRGGNSRRSRRVQPELLARHFTEAGLIESAAAFWGKAGQRSLGGSALAEAAEQLSQALRQISMLPSRSRSSARRNQTTPNASERVYAFERLCCTGNAGFRSIRRV